jgi:hypothetical protein
MLLLLLVPLLLLLLQLHDEEGMRDDLRSRLLGLKRQELAAVMAGRTLSQQHWRQQQQWRQQQGRCRGWPAGAYD